MLRFTKQEAIRDLRARSNSYLVVHKFDERNGRSQLWPKDASEATIRMCERAIAYGAMMALSEAARDLDSGAIGVPSKG